jgi:hypothetical protein
MSSSSSVSSNDSSGAAAAMGGGAGGGGDAAGTAKRPGGDVPSDAHEPAAKRAKAIAYADQLAALDLSADEVKTTIAEALAKRAASGGGGGGGGAAAASAAGDAKGVSASAKSAAEKAEEMAKELASQSDVTDALSTLLAPRPGKRCWTESEATFCVFARTLSATVLSTGGATFGAEAAPRLMRIATQMKEMKDGRALAEKGIELVKCAVKSGTVAGAPVGRKDAKSKVAADSERLFERGVENALFEALGFDSSFRAIRLKAEDTAEKRNRTPTAPSQYRGRGRGRVGFRGRGRGAGGRGRRSRSPPQRQSHYSGGGGGGGGAYGYGDDYHSRDFRDTREYRGGGDRESRGGAAGGGGGSARGGHHR